MKIIHCFFVLLLIQQFVTLVNSNCFSMFQLRNDTSFHKSFLDWELINVHRIHEDSSTTKIGKVVKKEVLSRAYPKKLRQAIEFLTKFYNSILNCSKIFFYIFCGYTI